MIKRILGAMLLASPIVGVVSISAISGRLFEMVMAFCTAFIVIAAIAVGSIVLGESGND